MEAVQEEVVPDFGEFFARIQCYQGFTNPAGHYSPAGSTNLFFCFLLLSE